MVIRDCDPDDAEPGKDVCLYTRDGKRLLGRHKDRHSAHMQEVAIEYAQARRQGTARKNPRKYYELPTKEIDAAGLKSIIEGWQKHGQKVYDRSFPVWVPTKACLLYTSPSPRDRQKSRMPSSA